MKPLEKVLSLSSGCLFILALIVSYGCTAAINKTSDPTYGHPSKVDLSLTPDEYAKYGLPPTGNPWTADDMKKGAEVLTVIARQDPNLLPRYRSGRSGTVFERITTSENLSLIKEKAGSVQDRLRRASEFTAAMNDVYGIYADFTVPEPERAMEFMEMTGALLRSTALSLETIEEALSIVMTSATKSEKNRFLKNYSVMQEGIAGLSLNCIDSIRKIHSISTPAALKLIEYLQETMPSIGPHLSQGSRNEALRRIDDLLNGPEMLDLKPQLELFHETIKNSVRKSLS